MKQRTWMLVFSVVSLDLFGSWGSRAFGQLLDDGLLDPSWFGGPVAFRELDEVDYLWVKPGFNLAGRTFHIEAWDDPISASKNKRDPKDAAKAAELTEAFPARLAGGLAAALDGIAKVSRKEGDIAVVGRIVDCNAGSKAAKFLVGMGAGSASATWDLKFVDRASGELLLAVHHRAISGSYLTDVDDKIVKWIEEFGKLLRGNLEASWAKAKAAKE